MGISHNDQRESKPATSSESSQERNRKTDIRVLRFVAYLTLVVGVLAGFSLMVGSIALGMAVIFESIVVSVFFLVIAGMADDLMQIRNLLSKD